MVILSSRVQGGKMELPALKFVGSRDSCDSQTWDPIHAVCMRLRECLSSKELTTKYEPDVGLQGYFKSRRVLCSHLVHGYMIKLSS